MIGEQMFTITNFCCKEVSAIIQLYANIGLTGVYYNGANIETLIVSISPFFSFSSSSPPPLPLLSPSSPPPLPLLSPSSPPPLPLLSPSSPPPLPLLSPSSPPPLPLLSPSSVVSLLLYSELKWCRLTGGASNPLEKLSRGKREEEKRRRGDEEKKRSID